MFNSEWNSLLEKNLGISVLVDVVSESADVENMAVTLGNYLLFETGDNEDIPEKAVLKAIELLDEDKEPWLIDSLKNLCIPSNGKEIKLRHLCRKLEQGFCSNNPKAERKIIKSFFSCAQKQISFSGRSRLLNSCCLWDMKTLVWRSFDQTEEKQVIGMVGIHKFSEDTENFIANAIGSDVDCNHQRVKIDLLQLSANTSFVSTDDIVRKRIPNFI